jgi:hypothetical protein
VRLSQIESQTERAPNSALEVEAALRALDQLGSLAADSHNLQLIGESFTRLSVRLFLRFEEVQPNKRKINIVAGDVVTFGSTAPPVALYEGPTGRRALLGKSDSSDRKSGTALAVTSCESEVEGRWLGNVSRDERT